MSEDTKDIIDHKAIEEAFLRRRTVVLTGDIDQDSSLEVMGRLLYLQTQSNDPINLVIASNGGSAHYALQICDQITTLMTAPIRGIGLGGCGSAATFIILHCKERIATPHCRFLIHSGTISRISLPINETTSETLEQLLRELKGLEEKVIQMYMRRLTPETWNPETTDEEKRAFVLKLISRGDQRFDDWMSAQEAVKIGLIDGIETNNLNIFTN